MFQVFTLCQSEILNFICLRTHVQWTQPGIEPHTQLELSLDSTKHRLPCLTKFIRKPMLSELSHSKLSLHISHVHFYEANRQSKEQSLNAYVKCQIIMIVLESHLDMSPCYTPLTQHLIQVPIFHNLTHQIWVLGYHTGVSVAEHLPHTSLNIHQNLTRGHRHHQLYNVHIIYL